MKRKTTRRWIEFAVSVLLPLGGLSVVLLEHYGALDRLRGLNRVEEVADRFSHSYSPDASKPVYPDDVEWQPTIRLIKKYSKAKLRTDKEAQTIARFKATLSTQDPNGSEWTSPSTPFAVLYRRWPQNSGSQIPPEDYTIVGSIGELQSWIAQSKSDFHFLINDVFLTLMAALLGYWLWRVNESR
jgi:hypothetical protein